MISIEALRKLALSWPEVTEVPHFEKTAFKVSKKIFATWDPVQKIACIKLSETDQHIFGTIDPSAIYPVNNKWGRQGWTNFDLRKVSKKLFTEALVNAYCEVAPRRLAALIKVNDIDK